MMFATQIDQLKDTPFFVPFVVAIAILYVAKLFFDWVDGTTKKRVDEAVKAVEGRLQNQIDELVRDVTTLREVNRAAGGHLLLAIDDLPHSPETDDSRRHLHRAIKALNGDLENGGHTS